MAKQDADSLATVTATLTATIRALTTQVGALETEIRSWRPLPMVGPQQINKVGEAPGGEPLVTVTYPWPPEDPANPTVLCVEPPFGTPTTRPAGTQGPYETGLQLPNWIVFSPVGPSGPSFWVPFTGVVPNA